jgi:hypothetical protein
MNDNGAISQASVILSLWRCLLDEALHDERGSLLWDVVEPRNIILAAL